MFKHKIFFEKRHLNWGSLLGADGYGMYLENNGQMF